MNARSLGLTIVPLAGFVVLLILWPNAAAVGWRIGFLTAAGPVLGAVLMLAIATLTGARWAAFAPLAALAPLVVLAAIGIGVIQIAAPPPSHLGLWQQPIIVGIRAVVMAGLLAWAASLLIRGASQTFAGLLLTFYAVVVTAIGSDWMTGGAPGHASSAVGMMLFTEELGGACAAMLVLGWGDLRFRRDMGKLLVAAGLGMSYLVFMDFLVLWYGDLPAKIGWYVMRSSPGMELACGAALVLGLFGPIAAQALVGGERGLRLAGVSGLVALFLINLWWAGGDLAALLASCIACWLIAAALALFHQHQRRRAHG